MTLRHITLFLQTTDNKASSHTPRVNFVFTYYAVSVLLLAAVPLLGDQAQQPPPVIEDVFADLEADFERLIEASRPDTHDSRPVQRARQQLTQWTEVPAERDLARNVTTAAPGEALRSNPVSSEYYSLLDTTLWFPKNADTAPAIGRMASGQVSSVPHYCARSVREALGWGLGNAHQWNSLPEHGYSQRPPGEVKAGDIVVWPFTYGKSNSQHIGFAVQTSNGIRLLSNMAGTIKLTPIVSGYRAYWKTS